VALLPLPYSIKPHEKLSAILSSNFGPYGEYRVLELGKVTLWFIICNGNKKCARSCSGKFGRKETMSKTL